MTDILNDDELSNELDIDLDVNPDSVGMPDTAIVQPDGPQTRECPKCGATVKVKKDGDLYAHDCVSEPVIDVNLGDEQPEAKDPKADWCEIIIDEVTGLANYETVGVNGTQYQIPRGVPTLVPPSVIEVLKNAVASRSIKVPDAASGRDKTAKQHYNAIPWRKV